MESGREHERTAGRQHYEGGTAKGWGDLRMQGRGAHAAAARGGDAVTAAVTRETSRSDRHSGGCPAPSDQLPESVRAEAEAWFGAGP